MQDNRVFEIPEPFLSKLQDHVDRLNRRAERLGLDPITVSETSRRVHQVDEFSSIGIVTVELSGVTPKIAGWSFLGAVDHEEMGSGFVNTLRSAPDAGNLPHRFRTSEPVCDHCETVRNRHTTYVIRNEEGEHKQVGSSCLRDFTGHKDAAAVAAYLEGVLALIEDLVNHDDYSIEEAVAELMRARGGNGGGSRVAEMFDLTGILQIAFRAMRNYGWVSRTKAREQDKVATADRVAVYITDSNYRRDRKLQETVDGEREAVDAAIAWASGMDEDDEQVYYNDYLWNLRKVATRGQVSFRELGLACSLLAAHKRQTDREREEAEARAQSEWVGEIKKRQQFRLTYVWTHSTEGYYGVTHIHKFEDETGNVFVWFTGKRLDDIGTVYEGKATVKAHEEYRDIKQTVLTRCAFEIVERPEGYYRNLVGHADCQSCGKQVDIIEPEEGSSRQIFECKSCGAYSYNYVGKVDYLEAA